MPLRQMQDLHWSSKPQSDPGMACPPQLCGSGTGLAAALGAARAVRATGSLSWWLADCIIGRQVLGLTLKEKLTSKGGNEGDDSDHFDRISRCSW